MNLSDFAAAGELHATITTEQAERILGDGYLASIALEFPPGINGQAFPSGTLTVDYPDEPTYRLTVDMDDFRDNVTDEPTLRAWAIAKVAPLRSVRPGSYPDNTTAEGTSAQD
jgi:hypothetical protein